MIVPCGEAIVDLLPEEVNGELMYRPVLGGSLYNVAVGIAQMGGKAGYLWELSTDKLGESLLANLKAVGVDTTGVRLADRPSVTAVVDLSGEEPTYAIADPGGLMTDTTPPALPAGTTCVHIGSAVLAKEPVSSQIEAAAKSAPMISMDFNVRPPSVSDWDVYRGRLMGIARGVDIVKASTADLAALGVGDPVPFMESLLVADGEGGPVLAILTAAADGAHAFTRAGRAFAPTRATKLVDTVGAGDAFMCGCLVHLQQVHGLTRNVIAALGSDDLGAMLANGQIAAAIVCSRRGAAMPSVEDMAGFSR